MNHIHVFIELHLDIVKIDLFMINKAKSNTRFTSAIGHQFLSIEYDVYAGVKLIASECIGFQKI